MIESNYFSAYRGQLVFKSSLLDNSGFSFGIMIIGENVTSHDLIRHEYGHFLQLIEMGVANYAIDVVAPSITAFILEKQNKLIYPYLGLSWEYDASKRGGDTRIDKIKSVYYLTYLDLLKMF